MSGFFEVLKFLFSLLYFSLVDFGFFAYNAFIERKRVSKPKNPILLLSASQLIEKLKAKELKSVDIIKAYVKRIDEVNDIINAAVFKNYAKALELAQKCDEQLELSEANSEDMDKIYTSKPLFGIPFTVKDSMEIEGLNITCGIPARKGIIAEETTPALKNIQNAGAILIAVTNVPELCLWMESSNTIYGRTNNPYDSRRGVGGSSGGEGAIIAAAGSVIGVGSDIGGSIRIPTIFNGVFGLKPTQDMVDGSRHIPIGMDEGGCRRELAVCGPLCRYAEDLPLMLKALAPEAYKDMKIDQPLELEDLQVYYIPHLNGYDKEPVDGEIVNRLYDVVRFLEMDAGMRSERVHFPEMDNIFNIWMAAMDAPGYPKIAEYITNQKYKVNLLTELFKAFAGRSEHTVAAIYGGISEEYPPFNDEGREKLLGDLRKLRSKVHKLLANNAVLVFPGWNTPAPYHNKPLLTPFNVSYTSVWNAMSTPVVAVPLGLNSDGLPIACQVVGAPKSERVLISVAQKLEQKFGGWVPPQ